MFPNNSTNKKIIKEERSKLVVKLDINTWIHLALVYRKNLFWIFSTISLQLGRQAVYFTCSVCLLASPSYQTISLSASQGTRSK